MLTRIVISLLLLSACDEPASSTSETRARPTPATASTSATTSSAATAKSSLNLSSERDPWEEIGAALQTLDDGNKTKEIASIASARQGRREVEDRQIERALLDVVAMMTEECSPKGIDERFKALSDIQAESLASDREALKEILEAAGPDGRAMLWDIADPEAVLPKSRRRMAKTSAVNLPSWLTSENDPERELQARRILIGLKFTIEGIGLDTQTELAEFATVVDSVDPESDESPQQIADALATIDTALLDGQRTKFQKLGTACEAIDSDYWLALLERGAISSYIGTFGGTAGIQDGNQAQGGGAMASTGGSKGSKSQTGGQTGQTGGQTGQTGGQPTGGQMGQTGGQMGQTGGQTGGQMGQTGGQTGGQMGQTGGTMSGQTGGTMSGQTGGQMGGQTGGQMGGQQTGGQMSGQTGGQQTGGQQTGGQQTGGQQTGGQQTGGQQTGGQQTGGQQTGGQQTGGQMSGQGGQMSGQTGGQGAKTTGGQGGQTGGQGAKTTGGQGGQTSGQGGQPQGGGGR